MDKNKKIRGLDKMEVNTKDQEKFKESELEALILKPTRDEMGVYSLTDEERKRYLSITEEELRQANVNLTFIVVWKATVDEVRRLDNKIKENNKNKGDENER